MGHDRGPGRLESGLPTAARDQIIDVAALVEERRLVAAVSALLVPERGRGLSIDAIRRLSLFDDHLVPASPPLWRRGRPRRRRAPELPGDIAVRISTASISWRALLKAFSMMSRSIGSTLTRRNGVSLPSIIVAGISDLPHAAWRGRIRMFPMASILPSWPGRTTVVESSCITTAGPSRTLSASSLARS